VVGTIDIDQGDPLLDWADDAVREVYQASLSRPLAVKERRQPYRARRQDVGTSKRRA
jgi:hypothetical protein